MHFGFMNPENLVPMMNITLAALLGAIIGLERDMHGRAAGLRTHLLVSTGAAVFTIMSVLAASGTNHAADPTRIASQIIAGIGFLGAGAIIKEGFSIKGLTTAACLWVAASIGMACGFGYHYMAVFTAMISLVALVVLQRIEKYYPRDSYKTLIIFTDLNASMEVILDVLEKLDISINHYDFHIDYEKQQKEMKFYIKKFCRDLSDRLAEKTIEDLQNSNINIKRLSWMK